MVWTINDFPTYESLSGWSTKGFLACPTCNKETSDMWLKNGRKTCYMGYHSFLPSDHIWQHKKGYFDGKKELRETPNLLSRIDVLEQLSHVYLVKFGKVQSKKRKCVEELNWTKQSIFFRLPYCKTLQLRHNLDVIHIEKNICENILGTLMNIEGKMKDNVKTHLDLQAMGLKYI